MSKDYPCIYWNDGKCKKFSDDNITSWCVWSPCYSQTPSNADKIRSMSDEELSWYLMLWRCEAVAKHNGVSGGNPDAQKNILNWLQQPVEEADNETVGERKDGDDNG